MMGVARAFANRPGQKGSTLALAALKRASLLSSETSHLIIVQAEGRVDAA